MKQILQALGYRSRHRLSRNGLKIREIFGRSIPFGNGYWNNFLRIFHILIQKKYLKFSDSLFCMQNRIFYNDCTTDILKLWIPDKNNFLNIIYGSSGKNGFFERHNLVDADGNLFKFKSHQPRHFLNTLAHMEGVTQEDIDYWSGRKRYGFVYNQTPNEYRTDQALENVKDEFTSLPSVLRKKGVLENNNYWDLSIRPTPISCKEKDVQQWVAASKLLGVIVSMITYLSGAQNFFNV
jgi:hypothetical protein